MRQFRKYRIIFSVSDNLFEDLLLSKMPVELYNDVIRCNTVFENINYHSEKDTYTHTKLVVNRLHKKYHNINLILAGLFHDLGKFDTVSFDTVTGLYHAFGHENESINYIERYKEWIYWMGGDVELVKYIVENHMRYKNIKQFKFKQQLDFIRNDNFEYLKKFNTADFGGYDTMCKPIEDFCFINKKIKEYLKKQKINNKISQKFNGDIIMKIYPNLRGKELGDSITAFKKSVEDFDKYALKNTMHKILNDFDMFLKQ